MTTKILPLFLCCILAVAADAARGQNSPILSGRAHELIRRNVLGGEERFPIHDLRVHQYGSVHIDGPSGGMLYKFKSNPEAITWIVDRKRLQQRTIDPTSELLFDFLNEMPEWWDPWQANPSEVYSADEKMSTGGARSVVVVYDKSTSTIYVVEQYSGMRGI